MDKQGEFTVAMTAKAGIAHSSSPRATSLAILMDFYEYRMMTGKKGWDGVRFILYLRLGHRPAERAEDVSHGHHPCLAVRLVD
jgi:hypothetical protein